MQEEMEEEVLADIEQPETVWDAFAEKRRAVAETKETLVSVPGYDREAPFLMIKYRLLDGPELDKLGAAVRQEFRNRWERTLYAAVDTFIAAVVGFYYDDGDGVPKPLTIAGEPVTGFTMDLAIAMKFHDTLKDPNSHRQVVFGLFANNDVAISQHNFQLNRWFGDTSLDVSRELLEGNL